MLLHTGTGSSKTNTSKSMGVSQGTDKNEERWTSTSSFSGAVQVDIRATLGTAVVRIWDQTGEFATIQILLDSGSQISVITKEYVIRLGLPRQRLRTV